jgi:Lon protease-like protein
MPVARRYLNVGDLPSVIPVFPLAGALLLPHTRLPLNIFEPRYLAMVDAAMSGPRLIGMIQPKMPGLENDPHPPLSNIGCVGRIVEYAETDDGRYLVTLLGIVRFRVSAERELGTPFREVAAEYAPFTKDFQSVEPAGIARERLIHALKPYLAERDMKTDWDAIDEAPVDTLVNALSVLCPFDPAEKQALLEAPGINERADTLIALLDMANAASSSGGSNTPLN